MRNKWFRRIKVLDVLLAAGAVAATVWFWRGFEFQNAYYPGIGGSKLTYIAPLAFRLLIPALLLFALFIYFQIRSGRLKVSNALLLVGSALFLGATLYPIAETMYLTRKSDIMTLPEDYHPYLQLSPTEFPGKSPKPSGEFRIMCLGGSTTEFSDSAGRGWPNRVEERLRRAYPDRDIRVYNMGRQWYTTQHTLFNYEVNLRHRKPDALIVMHTINDLLHNADFSQFSRGKFRDDYGHFFGPLLGMLQRKSLWSTVGEAVHNSWYFESTQEVVDTTVFPGIAPFKRNLNTLIDLAKLDGIPVFLMTQPSLLRPNLTDQEKETLTMVNAEAVGPTRKWSFESALRGFNAYTDAVQQTAMERDVFLIDLAKKVEKNADYFKDDVHYTDNSFDLVADAVSQGVESSGVVNLLKEPPVCASLSVNPVEDAIRESALRCNYSAGKPQPL